MAASVANRRLLSICRLKKSSKKIKLTATKRRNRKGKTALTLCINRCFNRIKNQLNNNSLIIE